MNDAGSPPKPKRSATDHLANERTFLAWVRTAIALMAFGFVVVKFALFVKQVSLVLGEGEALPDQQSSAAVGIFLVVLGAAVSLLAFFRYRRIEKQLDTTGYSPSKRLSVLLALAIVVCSILLVLYLVPRM
ncbi:MAG TPA: DUF202 domain-containing protein [Chitinophagaceae bacterium]